jgi:hypothetical protein
MNSCRRRDGKWLVAMNKWQDITDMEVTKGMYLLFENGPQALFVETVVHQNHWVHSPNTAGKFDQNI